MAIAEINSSGTVVQSNIKIVSMEKGQEDPTNAIIYAYTSDPNEMIINIKYQDKNKLICMYDTVIKKIESESNEMFSEYDNNTIFSDIDLTDNILTVNKKQSGIFNVEAELKIRNISTDKVNTYMVDSLPKNIYTYDNIIAINLGTEVHFINTSGWLLKKYTSDQEIKEVILCGNIAGIVYKGRIELISL